MIGIKEFYSKVLPSQGEYCVTTMDRPKSPTEKGLTAHRYASTVDELDQLISTIKKSKETNIFVCPMSFKNSKRGADNAAFFKSIYVDLDVGKGKGYATREEAEVDLDKFIAEHDLPPSPVKINSGRGLHAYWVFDKDIPAEEWKLYADKFKDYCLGKGLKIDTAVYDLARIMRCPDTLNCKETPPVETSVMSSSIEIYDWEEFKSFLGTVELTLDQILKQAKKGLSEEERKMHGLDNWEASFDKILRESIKGTGCNQIKHMYENPDDVSYDLWIAGLTVANKCQDHEVAIHTISERASNYSSEATIAKAETFGGVHPCTAFDNANPGGCDGCIHRGRITNPLAIGKIFKIGKQPLPKPEPEVEVLPPLVQEASPEEDWEDVPMGKVIYQEEGSVVKDGHFQLPEAMFPFVNGIVSGIYMVRPDKTDPKTKVTVQQEPIEVSKYIVYPMRRVYSPQDGACFEMRAILPKDPETTFILPLKFLHAQEKLNEILSGKNILIDPEVTKLFSKYLIQWGHVLTHEKEAEIMRTQMGWTDEDHTSFVIGDKEYLRDGSVVNAPISPLCRPVARHLVQKGSYEVWQEAANELNADGMELHVFVMLAGFASILMSYTGTRGASVCLTGDAGAAKTGAVYSGLSIWGDPEALYVSGKKGSTENAFVGRFLALHNLPFAVDEIGDIPADKMSDLIGKVANGKAKLKMQSAVNAEREYEVSASLIATYTSNHSIYNKLAAFKNDPNGEVARLIEFEMEQPQILKDDPFFGRRVFEKIRTNFGWAGPEYIKALYTYDKKDLLARIEDKVNTFKTDFGANSANRFYENVVSTIVIAGEIVRDAGILNFGPEKMYTRVVKELIRIREDVIQINKVDFEGLIAEYINRNTNGILAIKDGNAILEPKGALVIRSEVDTIKNSKSIFLAQPAFHKYLAELNVNTKTFKDHVKRSNIHMIETRRRLNAGWKDAGLDEYNLRCYIFNKDELSKELVNKVDGVND